MRFRRSAIPYVAIPVALTAGLLALLLLASYSPRSQPTPAPTETPTALPPSSTPAAVVVEPTRASPTSTPTATPTRRPATPTPTATATPPPTPSSTPIVEALTMEPLPKERKARAMAVAQQGPDRTTAAPAVGGEGGSVGSAPAPTMAGGTDINPLTGLPVTTWKLNRRPLGVKIPNYPFDARPQSGLSRADVVIEHEAEGYLTRFTAIFLGDDVTPTLGPIRSVRLVDSELMSIFKATLVTSGGHPAVKIRVTEGKAWAAGYLRIICWEPPFLGAAGTMRRIPREGRRYELTLYSDTESLWNLSTQRGINTRQDFRGMWVFDPSPPAGGRGATHLKIPYNPTHAEAEYRYDPGSRTYKRYDLGQPLIDELTGQQIGPSNVLVLYVNHVNSDIAADMHDPNRIWYSVIIQLWGEGPGVLLRDGRAYDVKWVRQDPQQDSDRLMFLDGQGNQVPLRPGPTWIQLVRLDAKVQID